MLIAYASVVGIGLVGFALWMVLGSKMEAKAASGSLLKDLADGDPFGAGSPAKKAPSAAKPAFSLSFLGKKKAALEESSVASQDAQKDGASVKDPSPKEELQDIKQALVDKLDQKCIKLEQILEEKNKILATLQKDLEQERSHRGEFESLKGILQQQIDDLKSQNRNLKDEIERILQENLRLQTGMVMSPEMPASAPKSEPPDAEPPGPVRAEAEDDIIPTHKTGFTLNEPPADNTNDLPPENTLTLKDIFGEEEKKNEQP